jgi:hypothetical protein
MRHKTDATGIVLKAWIVHAPLWRQAVDRSLVWLDFFHRFRTPHRIADNPFYCKERKVRKDGSNPLCASLRSLPLALNSLRSRKTALLVKRITDFAASISCSG